MICADHQVHRTTRGNEATCIFCGVRLFRTNGWQPGQRPGPQLATRKPKRKFGDPLPPKALEADVREAIRGAVNRLPWARVWLNQERRMKNDRGEVKFVPGLCRGSADLIGIVRRDTCTDDFGGTGIFLAIECKRAKGSAKQDGQVEWIDFVTRMGGVAGFAYTLGQALDLVAEARGVPRLHIVEELETIIGRTVTLE